MIPDDELEQMKADLWERLRHKEKKIVALEREVEELRKRLDVELDLNTHLVGRIDRLRAALRNVVEQWDDGDITYAFLKKVIDQARAALGG